VKTSTDALVSRYFKELEEALRGIPASRRREIVDEIREHVSEARSALETETESAVRNVLDRLGEPSEIAAEARERLGVAPPQSGTPWLEVIALILMLIPVVGWLAGLVLMWFSRVWTTRDKVIGTLFGPATVFMLGGAISMTSSAQSGGGGPGSETGLGPLEIFTIGVLIVSPIVTLIYLGTRLWARSNTSTPSRRASWVLGGTIALVILGFVFLGLFFAFDSDSRPSRITQAKFIGVELGDSKQRVSRTLGGAGDGGSVVSGLDPNAVEEPRNVGEKQFDDCWSYSFSDVGMGSGSDAAVCFDSSNEVVYTRVRKA
jgi:uncharacterized membrane protein